MSALMKTAYRRIQELAVKGGKMFSSTGGGRESGRGGPGGGLVRARLKTNSPTEGITAWGEVKEGSY